MRRERSQYLACVSSQVEIEAMATNLRSAREKRVVVRSHPLDELDHVSVAPHPGWDAPEVGECLAGIPIAPTL
jgi:hypothetical protein